MHRLTILLLVAIFGALAAEPVPPAGTGTAEDPYQIATIDNLQWLSETPTSWSSHFIQTDDIGASVTISWNDSTGFIPIGNSSTHFTGTYDGQDYAISGLEIHRPDAYDQGLFGYAYQAHISNIKLHDPGINGCGAVGALIGYCYYSYVNNCYVDYGWVSGADTRAGGLIGHMSQNTINDCTLEFTIVNGTAEVGGLIGLAEHVDIMRCMVDNGEVHGSGDNIGGLVGRNAGPSEIGLCSTWGPVTGANYVGGIIGNQAVTWLHDSHANNGAVGSHHVGGISGGCTEGSIDNCYTTGYAEGTGNYIGAVSGETWWFASVNNSFWCYEFAHVQTSSGGSPLTIAQMMSDSVFVAAGWDFVGETANGTNDWWSLESLQNAGFPMLSWEIEYPPSPDDLRIETTDTSVTLSWTPWNMMVFDSFIVYSAPSPDGPFTEDTSGTFFDTYNWTAPRPTEQRYYYVTTLDIEELPPIE